MADPLSPPSGHPFPADPANFHAPAVPPYYINDATSAQPNYAVDSSLIPPHTAWSVLQPASTSLPSSPPSSSPYPSPPFSSPYPSPPSSSPSSSSLPTTTSSQASSDSTTSLPPSLPPNPRCVVATFELKSMYPWNEACVKECQRQSVGVQQQLDGRAFIASLIQQRGDLFSLLSRPATAQHVDELVAAVRHYLGFLQPIAQSPLRRLSLFAWTNLLTPTSRYTAVYDAVFEMASVLLSLALYLLHAADLHSRRIAVVADAPMSADSEQAMKSAYNCFRDAATVLRYIAAHCLPLLNSNAESVASPAAITSPTTASPAATASPTTASPTTASPAAITSTTTASSPSTAVDWPTPTASNAESVLARLPVEYSPDFLRALALQALGQAQELSMLRAEQTKGYSWSLLATLAHDTSCKFRDAAAVLVPLSRSGKSARLSRLANCLLAKQHLYHGGAYYCLSQTYCDRSAGSAGAGFRPGHALSCLDVAVSSLQQAVDWAKKFEKARVPGAAATVDNAGAALAGECSRRLQHAQQTQLQLKKDNDAIYYDGRPSVPPSLPAAARGFTRCKDSAVFEPLACSPAWQPGLAELWTVDSASRPPAKLVQSALVGQLPSADDTSPVVADDDDNEDKAAPEDLPTAGAEQTSADCLLL